MRYKKSRFTLHLQTDVAVKVECYGLSTLLESGYTDMRSQDFVCGCTFFPKKVDDLFLVVALKIASKYTSNLSHPALTGLKN